MRYEAHSRQRCSSEADPVRCTAFKAESLGPQRFFEAETALPKAVQLTKSNPAFPA